MAAPPLVFRSDDARCPRYRVERDGADLVATCPRWPAVPSLDSVLRVEWFRVVGWHTRCGSHVVRSVAGGAEIYCLLPIGRAK